MDYLAKLIVYMLIVFVVFGCMVFFVCMDEIMYYADCIRRKVKSHKAKENVVDAEDNEELPLDEKPNIIRLTGKAICCLPILFEGVFLVTFTFYKPANGYSDVNCVFSTLAVSTVISLLIIIIGLLLCCYSQLKRKE